MAVNERTQTFVQAARAHYGAMLSSVSDDAIAAVVWRVSSPDRAIAKAQSLAVPGAVEALIGKPTVIVNRSDTASLDALHAAKYAAAQAAKAAVAAEPMAPLTTEDVVVELYVDDAKVGCGQRLFIVIETGKFTVRLMEAASLEIVTVDRKFFDKHGKAPKRGSVSRQRIASRIRERQVMADKVNDRSQAQVMTDGGADAVRALELLGFGSKLA